MLNGVNLATPAFNGCFEVKLGNKVCNSKETTASEDKSMVEALGYKVNHARLNSKGQLLTKNNMVVSADYDCLVVSRKDKETGQKVIWSINPGEYKPGQLSDAVTALVDKVKAKVVELSKPEHANLDMEMRMFQADLDRL